MFKPLNEESTSRHVVHLFEVAPAVRPLEGKALLRKAQTRAVIWAVMAQAGVESAYALEAEVCRLRGTKFDPQNPSKTFQELIRLGSPAIEKVLSWPLANRKTLDTLFVLDTFEDGAETMRHPIWGLLRPEPVPTKHLNMLRRALPLLPEDKEAELGTYPPEMFFKLLLLMFEGVNPDRKLSVLMRMLTELRHAEFRGDLPTYVAVFKALATIQLPDDGGPIVRALSGHLAGYLNNYFGRVRLVARTDHALAILNGRLRRAGLELRELMVWERAFPARDRRSRVPVREFLATADWTPWVADQPEAQGGGGAELQP